jgi:Zn-dependent M28 family amino/carboxypeptidase
MAHVSYLSQNIGVREEGTPGEASASTYIQQQLAALGYTVSTQSVPIAATGRTTQNVIARLPGTQRPARTIVLGAHMDSKNGPGANDNATGVAVLLELARVLKNNNRQAPALEFVFFGGEEISAGGSADQHHWGSRYFVNNLPAAERAAVAGMIAVDMVGTGKDFYANNMGLAPQTMRDFMLEAASGSGMVYRKESGMSDHEPFDRAGVPDVWLEYTGGNPYHEPGDNFASVDSTHVQTVGTILQQFFEGYLTPERVDQL